MIATSATDAWTRPAKKSAKLKKLAPSKALKWKTTIGDTRMDNGSLAERLERWCQNTGFDGGVNSPPMLAVAALKEQELLVAAATRAKILIGAGNDELTEAARQSNIALAWHLLTAAIRAVEIAQKALPESVDRRPETVSLATEAGFEAPALKADCASGVRVGETAPSPVHAPVHAPSPATP